MKCLWLLASILLGILAFVCIILFFAFFGCAYEFVKCYLNDKDTDDENNDQEMSQYDNRREFEKNQQNPVKAEGSKCKRNTIITILIVLGIFCQPLYLIFYLLYALMECSKRFGCWFYYADI